MVIIRNIVTSSFEGAPSAKRSPGTMKFIRSTIRLATNGGRPGSAYSAQPAEQRRSSPTGTRMPSPRRLTKIDNPAPAIGKI